MLDNQLISLLISTLNSILISSGFTNVTVQQKQQPVQQGVPTGPTIFIEKLFDTPYAYPYEDQEYDSINKNINTTMRQKYETTIQISSLYMQNPSDVSMPTASDLLNLVRSALLSFRTVQIFQSNGVGLLRVMHVRNPYFEDDYDRQEAMPSFDLIFTHERDYSYTEPVVSEYEGNIYRV